MTDIELYREVGKWINCYHNRAWRQSGLLKDFHHDLWLALREKEETSISFIKKHCWLYPRNAVRYKYYKRNKDFSKREVVLLDDDNQPLTDFEDNSFNPEYEFPQTTTKKQRKLHKDTKRIRVLYRNGQEEEFDSTATFADTVGVNRKSIQRIVGKPLSDRYTKRKLSHIKLITYIDVNP